VGATVGDSVGTLVGELVGAEVGAEVGAVGAEVGDEVGGVGAEVLGASGQALQVSPHFPFIFPWQSPFLAVKPLDSTTLEPEQQPQASKPAVFRS